MLLQRTRQVQPFIAAVLFWSASVSTGNAAPQTAQPSDAASAKASFTRSTVYELAASAHAPPNPIDQNPLLHS